MAKAPYYTGDNVRLGFTITDADGAVNPSVAQVKIVKPDDSVTDIVEATIKGSEVSYIVPIDVTDLAGVYIAYFELTLPGTLIRTHRMSFSITQNV